MKRFVQAVVLALLVTTALGISDVQAQGNFSWVEVWVNLPPDGSDPTHPNIWMRGKKRYTGLAYDKFRDLLYIVNPKDRILGGTTIRNPEIIVWDAKTGQEVDTLWSGSGLKESRVYVDISLVDSSFSQGMFEIYKIDVDDEGRIFACNVVAPLWGICYPGPPPDCDPVWLSQGPWRVYRWDHPGDTPKQVYATELFNPAMQPLDDHPFRTYPTVTRFNSFMEWTMWGTAFEVVGKRHEVMIDHELKTIDSARIYTSGGKFYSGYVTVNDRIIVLGHEDRPGGPSGDNFGPQIPQMTYDYRIWLYLQHNETGSGIAAHGIANTSAALNANLFTDSNFREVVRNNQYIDPNLPFPQLDTMVLNQSLAGSLTGSSGPIKYFADPLTDRSFLILADGNNSGQPTDPTNQNTKARAIWLDATPTPEKWPSQDTPPIGSSPLQSLTGIENFISDVDYKIWVDPDSGTRHIQVFVLMSENGIASYRTIEPLKPVEFQTFRGIKNGNNIDLLWSVTSEYHNHGFEIHRSFDGGSNWEQIGFREGAGTTHSQQQYSFTDPLTETHRNVGVVKYRLRQVDFDGTYEWSPEVEVHVDGSAHSVALHQNYPNPFNPSTKISYQIPDDSHVSIKVFNALGDEVAELVNEDKEAGLHVVNFDASGMTSGTYVYQINANGAVIEKKMVLMR